MKGSIYKLIVGDKFYIGSTISTLSSRLHKHKYQSKSRATTPLYKAIVEYDIDSITIELIEEIEFEIDFDLRRKEREHIELHLADENCLNVNKPARTKQESLEQARRLHKEQRIRENALKEPKEPKVRKKDDPDYNKKRWLEWADKNREHLRQRYKEQDAKRR